MVSLCIGLSLVVFLRLLEMAGLGAGLTLDRDLKVGLFLGGQATNDKKSQYISNGSI